MTVRTLRPSGLPLALLFAFLPATDLPWTGPDLLTGQEREYALPTFADVEICILTVDSTACPDESTILLQERALWVDVGANCIRGPHQVWQVTEQAAVGGLGDLSFGSDSYRASFRVDRARPFESDRALVGAQGGRCTDVWAYENPQAIDLEPFAATLTTEADTSRIPLWVGAAAGAAAGLAYGIYECQRIEAFICIPVLPMAVGALGGTMVVAIVR